MQWLQSQHVATIMALGCLLLLAATQVVIVVLNILEKRNFGAVQLGTVVTPLCTGFPNLMIGLFGQERLQGDLVLQLNVGNNIANSTLVVGLILLLAGPVTVQAGAGLKKGAKAATGAQFLAFLFLWLGAGLLVWLVRDGRISRLDGVALVGLYLFYQVLALRGGPKAKKGQELSLALGFGLLLLLALAAWLIQFALSFIGMALDQVQGLFPGWRLGMFLGLLTVLPESFLLLRLARRGGSLGLSGLVGDCLVSIPLVIGLSAIFVPFDSTAPLQWGDAGMRPYALLAFSMGGLTLLPLVYSRGPVPRVVGLGFVLAYVIIWRLTG